jgi:hypothetical protein
MAKKRKSKYAGIIPATDHQHQQEKLTWALIAILVCSFIASASTAYICQYVLDSFQDSHAMAMLITDAGVLSDDKNLESNLSVATQGLHMAKDFGLALTIGVVGVGLAVLVRIKRQKAS